MTPEEKEKYHFAFYKWICDHTNKGKPWTWTVRDFTRDNPLVIILIVLSTGMWIGIKCRQHLIYIIIAFLVGVLIGHVFW